MDQSLGTAQVDQWDFEPSGKQDVFTMSIATQEESPRRYELTHDQALLLALRISHRLRG